MSVLESTAAVPGAPVASESGGQGQSQRERSHEGLQRYFAAVALDGLTRDEKLARVAACFAEDCVLEAGVGDQKREFRDPKAFYAGPTSPVLNEGFHPRPGTLCYSDDGRTIAVEIALQSGGGTVSVGDFFEFRSDGRISRLRVYSG